MSVYHDEVEIEDFEYDEEEELVNITFGLHVT